MLRIPLKVTYSDGREQAVIVSAPDCIAFERQYDKPAPQIVSGRMEYLWWTTWHACKRVGLTADEFDTWVNGVGFVADDESTEAEPVPLASDQPIGG